MTKEEILKKIDELEEDIFYHEMKDRWNNEDFKLNDKYKKELKELKEKLEEIEKNDSTI